MKIKYKFVDGTVAEVEVDESIGTVITELRRLEGNLARKESYHCYSLEAIQFEGAEYSDGETPETLLAAMEEDRHLYEAFRQLSKVQRRRILMLAGGMSVNEIARKEGVHHSVVSETISAARKKFKKFF